MQGPERDLSLAQCRAARPTWSPLWEKAGGWEPPPPLHCSSCPSLSAESAVVLEEGSPPDAEPSDPKLPLAASREIEDFEAACPDQGLGEEKAARGRGAYSRVRPSESRWLVAQLQGAAEV